METGSNRTRILKQNLRFQTIQMIKNNFNIILYGPGGGGKNYAKDLLSDVGFEYGPSYASRPMRKGEIDKVDYNFISKEQFEEMIEQKEFLESIEFNGNYYGTTKKQFYEDCNLFIMTPDVVNNLSSEDRKKSIVILIDPPTNVVIERLHARGDTDDEINKRRAADTVLFEKAKDYDILISNPKFTLDEILDSVSELLLTKNEKNA